MKGNILRTSYKGFSLEKFKKLPVGELAQTAHESLQTWDKLNQRLRQDSTNFNQAPSTDSTEGKAKRKAEKIEYLKHATCKQGAQSVHKAVSRPLTPLSQGNIIIDCKPQICARCEKPLDGRSYSGPIATTI